jgi:hypothetical protein
MIDYGVEIQEIKVAHKIICDRCGREAQFWGDTEFEAQEFVSHRGCGGYGSIIGDMSEWSLDLCQHCFVELCGEYLQYHGLEDDEGR